MSQKREGRILETKEWEAEGECKDRKKREREKARSRLFHPPWKNPNLKGISGNILTFWSSWEKKNSHKIFAAIRLCFIPPLLLKTVTWRNLMSLSYLSSHVQSVFIFNEQQTGYLSHGPNENRWPPLQNWTQNMEEIDVLSKQSQIHSRIKNDFLNEER